MGIVLEVEFLEIIRRDIMPRGDMTGPLGEGPLTGRRGGKKSPRERLGPGWRGFGRRWGRGIGGMGAGRWWSPESVRGLFGK